MALKVFPSVVQVPEELSLALLLRRAVEHQLAVRQKEEECELEQLREDLRGPHSE